LNSEPRKPSLETTVGAIVASTEIGRSPHEVFAYAVDPANLAKWQENVVSATHDGVLGPGARVMTVRRLGKREQTMTMEMTTYDPPQGRSMRGVDGPVRPLVETRIEPLDDGARSRVTVELDFEGRGIGKVLVPLLVRPETRKGLPRNLELLRGNLEG
jgi:uncharacterized protein YndB with AHSA1/START domain